jgi:probable rRNA maturation factor
VLEVEVFGRVPIGNQRDRRSASTPSVAETVRLCTLVAASVGIADGHLAIEYVDAERIARLNAEYRDKTGPTDVLSFPIDGADAGDGAQRELGDVVICPEHTDDLCEAIVHGALHLLGMDHETDSGEMLALQARLLREARAE